LFIWIIDIKGYKKWSRFFEAFGINPLFMYVLGAVLSILIGSIYVTYGGASMTLKGMIYNEWLVPLFKDETFASLIFALLFRYVVYDLFAIIITRVRSGPHDTGDTRFMSTKAAGSC